MPEAAVDEDGEFLSDEAYIWADGSSAGCGVWSAECAKSPVATAPGSDNSVEAVAAESGVPGGFA